jgi:hypothetical protein
MIAQNHSVVGCKTRYRFNLPPIPARLDNQNMDTDFRRAWIVLNSLKRIRRSDWPFWLGAVALFFGVSYWFIR